MRTKNRHTARSWRGPAPRTIGVLSDTHGHIEQSALEILRATDLILHAGDLDRPEVLNKLKSIAPVVAVRGNMDTGPWSQDLPLEEFVEAGDVLIYLIHDLSRITLVPETAGIRVVVSGHTHRPQGTDKNGVLYLNPGSASFPRGGHKGGLALLEITGRKIVWRYIEL